MDRRSFLCFAALGVAVPLREAAATSDEVVARVEAFYEKVTTFEARFRQHSNVLTSSNRPSFTGSVIFEKPRKMSWRFGSGNRVVSDGARLKVYERASKRLYEQELAGSLYPVALAFLTGELGRDFRVTSSLMQSGVGPVHVLVARPRKPSAACGSLALYVDARSYEVHRVKIADAKGNRHGFEFDAAKVNTRVPPGEFTFSPPPRTTIIRR